MEPYPVGGDGVVRPLELLRTAKPTHVVSVADCESQAIPSVCYRVCSPALILHQGSDPIILCQTLFEVTCVLNVR